MAAAAVLAREAKQQEALALVAKARSRNGALLRAQLALEAGDTSQVSHAVTGVLWLMPCAASIRSRCACQPASYSLVSA